MLRWKQSFRCVTLGACVLLIGACGDDDGGSGASGTNGGSGGNAGSAGSSGSGGAGGTGGSGGSGGGAGSAGTGGSGGASGSGGTGGSAGTGVTGDCDNAMHQIFPPGAPWNTPITNAAVASDSQTVIDHLQASHTDARRFQIDFSIRVLESDGNTPRRSFEPTDDFYETECDTAPVPIPPSGTLEGESGYACESDGDCHLIVLDRSECRLYEMWRANIDSSDTFYGGCLAIWDVDRVYDSNGRGLHCSSADAAGLPIAPLLFTADEIAAGTIPHAIRIALPNSFIRDRRFVAPGTHATGSPNGATGGSDTPPYAARFRLKASTDLSSLSPAARVVADALKTYGMYLADGGNITFMGEDERDTDNTWEDVDLGPHDLKDLQWSDFEIIEAGAPITWNGNCERTVITQ